MSASWDQNKFDRWQELRKCLKERKRAKEYAQVIEAAEKIIDLDKKAPFIRIMTPLFHKEIGAACEKLGDLNKAIKNYQLAVDGFEEYRESNDLNKPDDWLKDIQSLSKKIERLQSKL
jgi:tetratricopeptide (TPR) repeat protein